MICENEILSLESAVVADRASDSALAKYKETIIQATCVCAGLLLVVVALLIFSNLIPQEVPEKCLKKYTSYTLQSTLEDFDNRTVSTLNRTDDVSNATLNVDRPEFLPLKDQIDLTVKGCEKYKHLNKP